MRWALVINKWKLLFLNYFQTFKTPGELQTYNSIWGGKRAQEFHISSFSKTLGTKDTDRRCTHLVLLKIIVKHKQKQNRVQNSTVELQKILSLLSSEMGWSDLGLWSDLGSTNSPRSQGTFTVPSQLSYLQCIGVRWIQTFETVIPDIQALQ